METFSALLALCGGNSPVTGKFPSQRPVTRSFDVFLDLRLNKRLNKQSWNWRFETPPCSLWRHCNDDIKCKFVFVFSTNNIARKGFIAVTSHECHDVPNHQPFDCLFKTLLRLPSKKTPKLRYWQWVTSPYKSTHNLPHDGQSFESQFY